MEVSNKREHIFSLFTAGVFSVNDSGLQDVEPDYGSESNPTLWLSYHDDEENETIQITIEHNAFEDATYCAPAWYVKDINGQTVKFRFYTLVDTH